MAVIRKPELEELYARLAECNIHGAEARTVIVEMLEVFAPTKLLDKYDKETILNWIVDGHKLQAHYNFDEYKYGIQLQFPELWEQQEKIFAAEQAMEKLAEFLLKPVDVKEL